MSSAFLLSMLSVNQLCDGNAMLKPHTINRVEACGTIDSHSVQFDHRRSSTVIQFIVWLFKEIADLLSF